VPSRFAFACLGVFIILAATFADTPPPTKSSDPPKKKENPKDTEKPKEPKKETKKEEPKKDDTKKDLLKLDYKDVSKEISERWEEAGARHNPGVIRAFGMLLPLRESQLKSLDNKRSDDVFLPSFVISRLSGPLKKLLKEEDDEPFDFGKVPAPDVPFALLLGKIKLSEKDLKNIGKFKNLTSLVVGDCETTPKALQELGQFSQLKHLQLMGVEMTANVLDAVLKLKNLESLVLMSCDVSSKQIDKLTELKNLKRFSISGNEVSENAIKSLSKLTKLTGLNLSGTDVSDDALTDIANFKELKALCLDGLAFRGTCFPEIGKLEKLEHLSMSDLKEPFPAGSLRYVFHLKNLKELDLGGIEFTGQLIDGTPEKSELTFLDLTGAKIPEGFLKEVGQLKKLETLEIGHTPTNDAGVKNLLALKSLKHIGLAGTKLTDESYGHIKQFKNLRYVNLAQTKMTEKGLKEFAGMKLEAIGVPSIEMTGAGIKYYLDALEKRDKLLIPECTLTLDALKAISKEKTLRTVSITLPKCEAEHIEEIAKWTHIGNIRLVAGNLDTTKFKDVMENAGKTEGVRFNIRSLGTSFNRIGTKEKAAIIIELYVERIDN